MALQSALRDAAKQDDKQGVVAIAKKAQDLYKQQQQIQKQADQRYTFHQCCSLANFAISSLWLRMLTFLLPNSSHRRSVFV